ncbi:hypothetical protein Adt_15197 [Abeliophyllum distichum]|uniref:Uncharacterized protein n=1 Tax=Abeliophyllum distichum TaxID=126358 RepID=A0ABD1U1T4_9LAMI
MSREENREAVEASKVIEADDSSAPEGDVPLSRKRNAPPLQKTLALNTSEEVVLEGPTKLSQKSGGTEGGSYESKRLLMELIGAHGARIPDDVLRNVPFYLSMGAQAMKKYFAPKWKEFSSHGDLEDVLEASLASVIRASAMQMKVLGEFRTCMQEQRKLSVEASKSDKEHRQALEGLQAALDSSQGGCRGFGSCQPREKAFADEVQNLKGDLKSSENGRKEAESEVARLMGEKKEMEEKLGKVEAKLENAEAEFVVNFYNTEAYTNFLDYFARVEQQEVLTVLRKDHPSFDIGHLEARFPLPDVESEEDS